MVKNKLIAVRTEKGFSQKEMADRLYMDQSQYSRRENGNIRISEEEWEKLSQILDVPVEDIFESAENQVFICKDNATGNYQGNQITYSIPEHILETQRKYIQKLEEEIVELKKRLG